MRVVLSIKKFPSEGERIGVNVLRCLEVSASGIHRAQICLHDAKEDTVASLFERLCCLVKTLFHLREPGSLPLDASEINQRHTDVRMAGGQQPLSDIQGLLCCLLRFSEFVLRRKGITKIVQRQRDVSVIWTK